jgi:glycosyltransferase involved in cell wall biosynthesis
MKITVIHQYYLLPGQPGGSRFNEFARMWAEAGHDVTVVCGALNYSTGEVPEKYRGRWTTRERDGQVTVIRCHVPRSYGRSYLGRMWAFFGFTLSSLTACFTSRRPDVVIATSPPLVTLIPGLALSRLRRTRLIFEIRDLWPESAITTGVLRKGSFLARVLYALEKLGARSADRINVLTPAFKDDLIARGLAPAEKIVFVPNGADIETFRPASRDNSVRRDFGWGEKFVAMYAGAHGRANALGQLIDAAEKLRHRPDILIVSVGDGPERAGLAAKVAEKGLTNIQFIGPQGKERMPDFVNACDVGLAVLQDNPTFRTVYPNKVFDYMACERPVVLAIDGVARKLVCEDAQAGLFARPESGSDIATAIERLSSDPALCASFGQSGRRWVEGNASRDALSERYLTILQALYEERRER